MDVRLTINWQQNADIFYRWTENWFFAGPSTFYDATATNALNTFLQAADRFHGNGATLVSARQVNLGNLRQVRIDPMAFNVVVPTGLVSDADLPTTAVLYKATGKTLHKPVRGWIRGVQDGMTNKGGKLQRGGSYGTLQNDYAAAIKAFCSLRTRTTAAKIGVSAIDLTTGMVTAAGHTFKPDDLVYLYRTRGVPYLHQSWVVASTVPTQTFVLKGFRAADAVGVLDIRKAYAGLLTYALEAIDTFDFVRASAHETARPLDRLPGRRKTRL